MNGAPEKTIPILKGKQQKTAEGKTVLSLEDFKLAPGDIVSLYATAKDANNLLVSLLESQLLEVTARREAIVEGINAHIAFETEARPLLARTTAQTTAALTTFRIP